MLYSLKKAQARRLEARKEDVNTIEENKIK
jgi:hypothetical protein